MLIQKDRLPRGMSFVLQASTLEKAMDEAGVTIHTTLYRMSGKIFFDAFFYPPTARMGYERLYVRAGAVPNHMGHAGRAYVESSVLPDLMTWVGGILALPERSPIRREQQMFWRERPSHLIP